MTIREGAISAEEAAFLEQIRAFAETTLAKGAPVWTRERRMGLEALQEAAERGFLGLQTPKEFGGLGFSFACKAAMAEILGAVDYGFAMSMINTHNVAAKIANDARPEVAERFVPDLLAARRIGCTALTEPGAGSDFAAIATTATRDGAGWRLNGEKAWIINGAVADTIVLYAQTEPGSRNKGIASFLVDVRREGAERREPFNVIGQHSIGAGGFVLTDYRVEPEEALSAPGEAFKAALQSINGARIYVGAMCCGMVGAALETASEYGRRRQTFGRPLLGHQGWRWQLAEADTDLAAARHLVHDAAARLDAGEDVQLAAARAKIFATRMAERHLPILAQLMGAEGLRDDYPFGRHMVGMKMAGFTDGSTEILLDRIGRSYEG